MRGRIVASLLLAIGAAGCGASLQDYNSPDGRYHAQFPGTPKLQERQVPTPVGLITAKFATTEDWFGTARMVMYADYPPHLIRADNRDAALEGACEGMAKEAQLKIVSKVPIAIDGHSGREVNVESLPSRPGPSLNGRVRIYLVGPRLYQVMIIGRSGVIQSDTIAGFLDSFGLAGSMPGPSGPVMAGGPSEAQPASFGPGPMGPRMPGQRGLPGPPPNAPARPAPNPSPQPAPAPAESPAAARIPGGELAFYEIPDPISTPITADSPFRRRPAANPFKPKSGGALADARPSKPESKPPSPLLMPDKPEGPPADPSTPIAIPLEKPRRAARPRPAMVAPPELNASDREAIEIPSTLNPTGGGSSILSFEWLDRSEDYVGPDGRTIAPGRGKDEHFRLVMDLPAAAIVEEVAITGGPIRWTTKPVPHSWPVAIVANQQLKNRRQSLRIGPFSGRWTFDLYAESDSSVRPGQPFGVDVVVYTGGTRYHLTARCQSR